MAPPELVLLRGFNERFPRQDRDRPNLANLPATGWCLPLSLYFAFVCKAPYPHQPPLLIKARLPGLHWRAWYFQEPLSASPNLANQLARGIDGVSAAQVSGHQSMAGVAAYARLKPESRKLANELALALPSRDSMRSRRTRPRRTRPRHTRSRRTRSRHRRTRTRSTTIRRLLLSSSRPRMRPPPRILRLRQVGL